MIEPEAIALAIASQQVQEGETVFLIGKDRRAVVAAIEDVIAGGIGPKMTAWDAWHGDGSLCFSMNCRSFTAAVWRCCGSHWRRAR